MKITVFTSNQPRHLRLIAKLCAVADEVVAIQECSTLFTGKVADSIYQRSALMEEYFSHVIAAEKQVFGDITPSPSNARTLSLKMGDVAHLTPERIGFALNSDVVVVFGASYIKPPLVDVLIEKKAVNIHMGISPYYRGSSCNFWAVHDGRPELVGATIHRISRGLDSGDMLFHALPKPAAMDAFLLGMKAVEAAQDALCQRIADGSLLTLSPVAQDRTQELRYSRHTDFSEAVVEQYLPNRLSAEAVGKMLVENQGKYTLLNAIYA